MIGVQVWVVQRYVLLSTRIPNTTTAPHILGFTGPCGDETAVNYAGSGAVFELRDKEKIETERSRGTS
jgi:hypothetical protein